jgi:hypothetical protein
MPKNASVQQVQARRVTQPRVGRAEIFTIGPRKALMEQLEARTTINPVRVRVKAAATRARYATPRPS